MVLELVERTGFGAVAVKIELPDTEWDTVGGLVIAQRGWIPQAGERFDFEDGVSVEVVEVSPRRVKTVRIAKRRAAATGTHADP